MASISAGQVNQLSPSPHPLELRPPRPASIGNRFPGALHSLHNCFFVLRQNPSMQAGGMAMVPGRETAKKSAFQRIELFPVGLLEWHWARVRV